MTKSLDSIPELLKKRGPLASRQIVSIIEKAQDKPVSKMAARKRLERAVKERLIERFVDLGKNQYLYCLPDQHADAEKWLRHKLRTWNPRLFRLVRVVEEERIITVSDASRIAALPRGSVAFRRTLENLEHLGFATRQDARLQGRSFEFIISRSLQADESDLLPLLEDNCRKLITEENFIQAAELWLRWNNLAVNFKRSRERSNPFDSIGRTISPRFSLVLLEVNIRRKITRYEMQGLIDRVQRFVGFYRSQARRRRGKKRKSKMARSDFVSFPVFPFFIAKDFDGSALEIAKAKVKTIRLDCIPACRVFRKPDGLIITKATTQELQYTIKKLENCEDIKHSTSLKGMLFEMMVDLTFRKAGYDTSYRKKYYVDKGNITENETKTEFSDVDVQATREGSFFELILVECRNWDRALDLATTTASISKLNRIAQYLKEKHVKLNEKPSIEILYIGPVREEDKQRAIGMSEFKTEILTKKEFRDRFGPYNEELERVNFIFE